MNGKQFRVLAVLTVVSGFLGGAVSNLALRGAPALAQGGGAVHETVRARRFELVDNRGETRAMLATWDYNTLGLFLVDAAGKRRAELTTRDDGGSSLSLFDTGGGRRVLLGTKAGGFPHLALFDAAGKTRASLVIEADESPVLYTSDAQGTTRARIGRTTSLQANGTFLTTPESTITLYDGDGAIEWQAP